MIRPMPFWPSFEPWAKETPVQVSTRMPRIHRAAALVLRAARVEFRVLDQQRRRRAAAAGGADETDHRRDQQRHGRVLHLAPVDAVAERVAGAVGIHQADADDRADQGVRARGRQAQIPGAEIPDDRREQQGEDHGEPGPGADIDDQFDRQQGDDAEGHRPGRGQHADEVPAARPDDGDDGPQRMGVDHRRHGVGRIVKTVDEFEAERQAESDDEENRASNSQSAAE